MLTPLELFDKASLTGFPDFMSLGKEIISLNNDGKLEFDSTIKIAFLSSSSSNGIKEVLTAQCSSFNIFADVYVPEYGQYAQEILSSNSQLYDFDADLIIINIDFYAITDDYKYIPYSKSSEERKHWSNQTVEFLDSFVSKLIKQSSAKVLIHNLELPIYSPMGILENKKEYGFLESIENVNKLLREKYKSSNQAYIFDFDGFCSKVGKSNLVDYKMYYLADIKIKTKFIPDLCNQYLKYIHSILFKTKKCIVLDLDNTLWGGVIGEDGIDGIELGPTSQGRSFLEFQKNLLALYDKGIILAINSKNNEEDAKEVLANHPYMILREKHFSAIRINWDDKVSNLKSIALEINIGLDSIVFFDDDKVNQDMVKTLLPEVSVIDMPKDFSQYSHILKELNFFETLSISSEDANRGIMYQAQKERNKLFEDSSDLSDYLRSLDMIVLFEEVKESNIPRIAQLTQKTNQFNLTTKRYSEDDISIFSASNNFRIISLNVLDKFGDNGLTGLAIIDTSESNVWKIDTFLLSCRVIGRKVEEALLAFVIDEALARNVKIVLGYFAPSKKNSIVRNFYKNNYFNLTKRTDKLDTWELIIKNKHPYPEFMKCQKI